MLVTRPTRWTGWKETKSVRQTVNEQSIATSAGWMWRQMATYVASPAVVSVWVTSRRTDHWLTLQHTGSECGRRLMDTLMILDALTVVSYRPTRNVRTMGICILRQVFESDCIPYRTKLVCNLCDIANLAVRFKHLEFLKLTLTRTPDPIRLTRRVVTLTDPLTLQQIRVVMS